MLPNFIYDHDYHDNESFNVYEVASFARAIWAVTLKGSSGGIHQGRCQLQWL